ncbi:Uncharacterized protein AC501_1285 [Pseudomonas amygdali pv. lachrymans]|nr:Uncharacterized protein AC501_1285 [Pseudomonas amygdali pv. lachrymans]
MQHGTGTQCGPHFPGHGVKPETRHARRMTASLQIKRLAMPVHEIDQRAVFNHDAFGLAGGTGGVDDVSQIMLIKARYRRVAGARLKPVNLLDVQLRCIARQIARRIFGQDHARCAVLQQVSNALCRVDRIYRHVRSTGLEHRQHGDQPLRATVQTQCDSLICCDTQTNQMVSQVIGTLVQLRVGQDVTALNHRRTVGSTGCLRFDQRIHRAVLHKALFIVVEIEQQMAALFGVENRNVFQLQWPRLFQRLQQMRQRVEHPASDALGAHALQRQDMQVEAFTQIVHAERQRVVAAHIAAEHPHALPETFTALRLYVSAVAVIEQCTEQRRT